MSLLESNNNVTIHIFTMNSPETNQKRLSAAQISQLKKECSETSKNFKIKTYDVREHFDKHLINSCNNKSFYTPYAALRLLAPFVLGCDKVLYLDCDIIVLKSLDFIYKRDFNDKSLLIPEFIDKRTFHNSIYLQNLKKERENNFKEEKKAIFIYNTYVHEYPDMHAMNVAFKNYSHLYVGNLFTYNYENSFVFHISSKEVDIVNEFLTNAVFSKSAKEIRKKIVKIVQFIDKMQFKVDKNWHEMISLEK